MPAVQKAARYRLCGEISVLVGSQCGLSQCGLSQCAVSALVGSQCGVGSECGLSQCGPSQCGWHGACSAWQICVTMRSAILAALPWAPLY